MADTPIRTHSRKGFIIGWIAIVTVGTLAFALASMPLRHSYGDIRLANSVYVTQPDAPKG